MCFFYVMQNIVSATCPSKMRDWSKVTIETDPCVGVTRRALSDIMEKMKAEIKRLSKCGEQNNIFLSFISGFHGKMNGNQLFFSMTFPDRT